MNTTAEWHFKIKGPGDKIRIQSKASFLPLRQFKGLQRRLSARACKTRWMRNSPPPNHSALESSLLRVVTRLVMIVLKSPFGGAWDHFEAQGNGLRDVPAKSSTCAFLVFEDFETTGLQGDVEQSDEDRGTNNPFFYFFRAEGLTSKSEQDRGRWGVGKYVFPRSSRINAFFGVTVRSDDRQRLMMGQAVLKHHRVGVESFRPDGDFGELRSDGLVLPVRDNQLIEEFCKDWHVARRSNEPGLSIVVPYIDPEITEASLRLAIIRGYFYPILTGSLVATIATPEGETCIDDSNLIEETRRLGEVATELVPMIELAEWAALVPPAECFQVSEPIPDRAPKWGPDRVSAEDLCRMTEKFRANDPVAVKVPVLVREGRNAARRSFFHVFLRRDREATGRPVFIREGVIISDVHAPRAPGVRSLVVAEDKAIAAMLGDSENPAHTQWQKDSSNFKGKYERGPSWLTFVTKSVAEIVRLMSEQEREEDPTLLSDVFSLPALPEEEPDQPEPEPSEEPGTDVQPPPPPPPPPPGAKYVLHRVAGGFSIVNGPGVTLPLRLEVRTAYDVRRGNPFKKYDRAAGYGAADFDVGTAPIRFDPAPVGAVIENFSGNRLEVVARALEFRATIVGFDERRDLITRVRILEDGEA